MNNTPEKTAAKEKLEKMLDLIDELCNAVDCEGADVGGQRRGSLAVLREIGPALYQAKKALNVLTGGS